MCRPTAAPRTANCANREQELRELPEDHLREPEQERPGRPRPLKEQAELQEHHLLLHELEQELHDALQQLQEHQEHRLQ